MGLVIFLVGLWLLAAVAVMASNRLVALGRRSEEAWSDVDVQLERGYFELDRPEDRQVPKVAYPGRA